MREEAAKRRVDLKKQVEEELKERLRKAEEEDEARVNAEEEKHESFKEGAERIEEKARGSSPEEWTAQGQPRASQERVDNWFEDYKKKKQLQGEEKYNRKQAELFLKQQLMQRKNAKGRKDLGKSIRRTSSNHRT